MDEDEAALLAELRAISDKSASSRFADGNGPQETTDTAENPPQEEEETVAATETDEIPASPPAKPWQSRVKSALGSFRKKKKSDKRKSREGVQRRMSSGSHQSDRSCSSAASSSASYNTTNEEPVDKGPPIATLETVFSEENAPKNSDKEMDASTGFQSQNQASAFQGERGGAAEDPELLALLRGVSSKASGASRFDDEDNDAKKEKPMENQDNRLPDDTNNHSPTEGPAHNLESEAQDETMDPPPPQYEEVFGSDPPMAVDDSAGYGIKSETPSTFAGERGGAAEDAELLALLRGVSSKSSGADRFANDDNGSEPAPPAPVVTEPKNDSTLPPWKRKKKPQAKQPDVDVVVAAPPAPAPAAVQNAEQQEATAIVMPDESAGYGIKSETPSTFAGERGGAAEDAELLALLRGVSSKSSGADRFANDDNGSEPAPPAPVVTEPKNDSTLPPWKRKKKPQAKQPDVDVVVAAPPAPAPAAVQNAEQQEATAIVMPDESAGYGIKSETPSTFAGERGGAAEDAELLALLRGVSSKSSGTDRFANDDNGSEPAPPAPVATEPENDSTLPPWKRKKKPQAKQPDVDVVVAAPPAPAPAAVQNAEQQEATAIVMPDESAGYGIKSETPSTFAGERGGAAEDAELLALLRGVSSKSSGTDRFANNDNSSEPAPPAPVATEPKNDSTLPPWKRKKKPQAKPKKPDVDVVVAAPPAAVQNAEQQEATAIVMPDESAGYGIKSETPSTFAGERGGAAEDAELLALLRGVSSKSSGTDRFANDDNGSEPAAPAPVATEPENDSTLPPWKRKKKPQAKPTQPDVDVVVAAPPAPAAAAVQNSTQQEATAVAMPDESAGYGIKSDVPNVFIGDRGGAAEDAELLALLRGVSSGAPSSSRFAKDAPVVESDSSMIPAPIAKPGPIPSTQPAMQSAPQPSSGLVSEVTVSREDLPQALSSKNWKIRAKAFELLSMLARDLGRDSKPGTVDSDSLLEGLDTLIPKFVEDTHPATLDKALEFCLLYSDFCRAAGDKEQAGAIVGSLIKKNALSSRPSSLKLATTLILKLMEVGSDGRSSLHTITEMLMDEGVSAKKPKVVQASVSILYQAMIEFGAENFPLASITSKLPKILAHTNVKARETGVEIVAELCRVLGSKGAIQGVFDSMKKTQISQVDSLLADQPQASQRRSTLRCMLDTPQGVVPVDASAVMAAQAEELEAERFAKRPAVDVVAAVSRTDFSARIELKKWSEKVAALNTVLECGGEKPYKLSQPSSSVNYQPLISDMKQLLAHTHFAVVSKAMMVLAMLAQGVGEKLFPHLRPLLGSLLQLSKDKKLTKGVADCLDAFFGNVLGFDHLLDKENALPEALNEKYQRNALARTTAMEYLWRCVKRHDSAGPRSSLSTDIAEQIAFLSSEKLADSDAGVRKSALIVLQELQNFKDTSIQGVIENAVYALKTSNPRAYKVLSKGSSDAAKSAPVNAPTSPRPARSTGGNISVVKKDSQALPLKNPLKDQETAVPNRVAKHSSPNNPSAATLEDALEYVTGLGIAEWDSDEDDGGVLAGLKSSKWLLRQNAIKVITSFVGSGEMDGKSDNVSRNSSSILTVVKEHTRGFKETNVNILKAIIQLFMTMIEYHEAKEVALSDWVVHDGVTLAVQKLSDRKLSSACKVLLAEMCVVSAPALVLAGVSQSLEGARSPLAHEEALKWFHTFCDDFGAGSLGHGLSSTVLWVIDEIGSSNPKVKREALAVIGTLYTQVGTKLKALSMSMAKQQDAKNSLEKCFNEIEFDPSAVPTTWKKYCMVQSIGGVGAENEPPSVDLDIPKTDLLSVLPPDIISQMTSKDGKAAWKHRKGALDAVEKALSECSGMLESMTLHRKQLVDLSRAIRDRLSDTQINLKPVAARCLGKLLSLVDKSSQAKLGKIVYGPLLLGAMNDIKKPMRDACLEALRVGTSAPSIEGGELNEEALESLVSALVTEVNESSVRAGGLPGVLLFLLNIAECLPNLDTISSSRGQMLGPQFASVIIECLTSSKSETRAAATSLLEVTIANDVVSRESINKASGKLKPAKQRTVAPLVAKFSKAIPTTATETTLGRGNPAEKRKSQAMPPRIKQVPTTSNRSGGSRTTNARTPKATKEGDKLPAGNPLAYRSSSKPSSKGITWVEYPEEPHGTSLFGNLKKAWAHTIPADSLSILFPGNGFRKQDEVKPGCELIGKALDDDRSEGTTYVQEQFQLVTRWIAFALCSRETTVGQQALLVLIKNLFSYVLDVNYEISDLVALEIVPYLLEKASNAKGRFKDMFDDVIRLIRENELLSAKRFGSVVCVAVIDGSAHAKARVLASHICQECIDVAGLNGCGKKGVMVAARRLSEEKVAENKMASLALMESVFARMNGDAGRLARICGSCLSGKAMQLLKERWAKRESKIQTPQRVSHQLGTLARPVAVASPSPSRASGTPTSLYDELPALSLRHGEGREFNAQPRDVEVVVPEEAANVFSFQRTARAVNLSDDNEETTQEEISTVEEDTDGARAAAALRARLVKMKEKTQGAPEDVFDSQMQQNPSIEEVISGDDDEEESFVRVYEREMNTIRFLLTMDGPISEEDPSLIACIDTLKRFHAALSRQQNTVVDFSESDLLRLRECIVINIDASVEQLTQLISFAFYCGEETINAMMSIPLLSVCLATLMALFRDPALSTVVSQENLTLLIRETGTALLDSRLSSTSDLDEATGAQMVRAINKLAVQAATGASRHSALLALMTLQHQLSREAPESEEDEAFRSRLSRVVTKLFNRVIKSEEGTASPFSVSQVDLEALVCWMEDLLVACDEMAAEMGEATAAPCKDMVYSLVEAIVKAHGGTEYIQKQLDALGIDRHESALGAVIEPYESSQTPEEDTPSVDADEARPYPETPTKGPLKDVASLVSALASAPAGPQRETALASLRSFRTMHGDAELNAHLEQVSSAFRAFIEEQLGETEESNVADANAGSMTDRLASLRSRLQATELAVQTVAEDAPAYAEENSQVVDTPASESKSKSPSPTKIPSPSGIPSSVHKRGSRLSAPSPSKLVAPGSRLPASSSVSLRERLVKAQESRKGGAQPSGISSSISRAASLRARLEAVKKKGKSDLP